MEILESLESSLQVQEVVPDRDTAMTTRDQIANDMWDQYQQGLQSS